MKIKDAAKRLSVRPDTLRYYEKIGLLRDVPRTASGIRIYPEKTLRQVEFILRSKNMGFTLEQIRTLMDLRENPSEGKPHAQSLAKQKISDLEEQLTTLHKLREELMLLVSDCRVSKTGCPILESLDGQTK